MKFRYDGDKTVDPVLGELTPGMEGEGPDDVVALKIAAGLLTAVPAAPADADAAAREGA